MEIDEKFMSNKYDKYKAYILKKLGFDYGQQSDKIRHDIDAWIRDYYVDGMSEYDCIQAIQDQFRRLRESTLDEDAYMDAMDRELDDIHAEKILEKFFFEVCKRVNKAFDIELKMHPNGKKKIDGEDVYFAANKFKNYRDNDVYVIVRQEHLDCITLETSEKLKNNEINPNYKCWYLYTDEQNKIDEAIKEVKAKFDELMTKQSFAHRAKKWLWYMGVDKKKAKDEVVDESIELLENAGYIVEWSMDDANETFNLEHFADYLYTVREILVKRGFSRGKQADNYDELHDIAYSCCAKGFNTEECAKMIINKIK